VKSSNPLPFRDQQRAICKKHNQGRARSINANDFEHLWEGTKRNWKRYDKALHIINAYALHKRLLRYMLATEISGKETIRTASLPTAHLAVRISQSIERQRSDGTPNEWDHISKSLKAGVSTQLYLISQACSGHPFFRKLLSTNSSFQVTR